MKNIQKLDSNGFGVFVLVLFLVVIVASAAVGLVLVRSKTPNTKAAQTIAKPAFVKAHLAGDCADEAKTYVGKTVIGSNGKYRFCLPNGFEGLTTYNAQYGDITSVLPGPANAEPTYQPAKPATLYVTDAGKDGTDTIDFIFYPAAIRTPDSDKLIIPENHLQKVSAAYGANVTGTKFERTDLPEATYQPEALGAVPVGTVQYIYRFEQNKDLFVVDYYKMPGNSDQTALLDAIASTVTLN